MSDSSQSWKPGIYCTAYSSSACWRVSSPSDSVGLNTFQAPQLVFVSSRFGLGPRFVAWILLTIFIVYSGRERLSESSQFQGLPESYFSCLLSVLRSFPERWVFNLSLKYPVVSPPCKHLCLNKLLSKMAGFNLAASCSSFGAVAS